MQRHFLHLVDENFNRKYIVFKEVASLIFYNILAHKIKVTYYNNDPTKNVHDLVSYNLVSTIL